MTHSKGDYHKSPTEAEETPHNTYPSPLLHAQTWRAGLSPFPPESSSNIKMILFTSSVLKLELEYVFTETDMNESRITMHFIILSSHTEAGRYVFSESLVKLQLMLCGQWAIIFVIQWTLAFYSSNWIRSALQPAQGQMGIVQCWRGDGGQLPVGYYRGATLEGAVQYCLCQTYHLVCRGHFFDKQQISEVKVFLLLRQQGFHDSLWR